MIDFERRDRIGLITLNRPEARNSQSPEFLAELDAAWTTAERDDEVRVIVLKAEGKHFSAGHDVSVTEDEIGVSWGKEKVGMLGGYKWELEHFFGYSRRWRDIPKPSIAAVQGACIAAGLMLCWPCDLIIASEDAYFSDPVLWMGMPGVEYHGHTWEWGPRKAKEMLFTAAKMSASEAAEAGMVNRVVPREQLLDTTLELAEEIAQMNPFGLAQVKRIVNNTMDIAGQHASLQAAYENHWLGHANSLVTTNNAVPVLVGLEEMKAANKDG